jgi:multidrug resistance efflux pump
MLDGKRTRDAIKEGTKRHEMSTTSNWRQLYRSAMWEPDLQKAQISIEAARAAITARRKELQQQRHEQLEGPNADVMQELLELANALSWLNRRQKLSSTDLK